MKNKKNKKVLLLVLLLLGITVGFAALSTTLKINGTTGINSNQWNVYWENKSVNVASVSQATPTLSAETGKTALTIATWSATLNLPGDFYEFTINAVNAGTIDAMISEAGVVTTHEANNINTPSTLPAYISYTVTYEDGTPVAAYHLLSKKSGNTPTKEAYKVRVEFLDTITPEQLNAIPEGGYSYTFTTQVQYVQADSNAIDSHPAANPYLTRFDGNYTYKVSYIDEFDTSDNEWDAYLRYDGTKYEACGVFGSGQEGTVCMTSSYYNSNYSDSYESDFEDCEGPEGNYDSNNTCIKGYAKAKADEMLSKGASSCSLYEDNDDFSIICDNDDLSCSIGSDGPVSCTIVSDYVINVYNDGSYQ